jgi:ABC-type transport system involved in multi-copper enzyme maturation permease subunit
MPLPVRSTKYSFRWPATRIETFGLLGAVAGFTALFYFGGRLRSWQQASAWLALSVLILLLLKRLWLQFFGPVFFYDLLRTARQGRTFFIRGAYATCLLMVLSLVYFDWFGHQVGSPLDLLTEAPRLPLAQVSRLAESFFTLVLAAQFALVLLLTPIYTAGAIADERIRRTLDDLLATDLLDREIIFGKLAARLTYLFLLLLTGLPILCLLQLLGGVDPLLIAAGFVVSAFTMLSLAGLGLFSSTVTSRPFTAAVWTCAVTIFFLLFSAPIPGLYVGNPFVVYYQLKEAAAEGALAHATPRMVLQYAALHSLGALGWCLWAAQQLRQQARPTVDYQQALLIVQRGMNQEIKWATVLAPESPLLPIRDNPLLWKERRANLSGINPDSHGFGCLLFLLTLALFVAVMGLIPVLAVTFETGPWSGPSREALNIWVRCSGSTVATLMLLRVATRAATTFSDESAARTLDSLLTTPVDDRAILRAKWLGSMLSVRMGLFFLGGLWGLGVLAGGLFPVALPLVVASWLANAALLISMGMWFSLMCRTTLRATLCTLLAALAVYVGPSLLRLGWHVFLPAEHWSSGDLLWANFQSWGAVPPLNLWCLALSWSDYWHFDPEKGPAVLASLMGVLYITGLAAIFWCGTRLCFARVTGRMPGNVGNRLRHR